MSQQFGRQTYEQTQIALLVRSFPGSRSVAQRIYEVPLQLPTGQLYIQIRLENYPQYPPNVLVAAKVKHSMIGQHNVINYPQMQQWNPQTPLIEIVAQIHRSFSEVPPIPDNAPEPKQDTPAQSFQSSFEAVIESMKEEEMRQIMMNQDELEFLVYKFPEIQSLMSEKRRRLQDNCEIAEQTFTRKAEFDQLNQENGMHLTQLMELKTQLEDSMATQNTIMSKIGKSGVSSELTRRRAHLAEECQNISTNFKDGSLNASDFVGSYLQKRVEMRMAENILNLIPPQ